jgi:hypothetical protein
VSRVGKFSDVIFAEGLQPFASDTYQPMFDKKTNPDTLFVLMVTSDILAHKIALEGRNQTAIKEAIKRYAPDCKKKFYI